MNNEDMMDLEGTDVEATETNENENTETENENTETVVEETEPQVENSTEDAMDAVTPVDSTPEETPVVEDEFSGMLFGEDGAPKEYHEFYIVFDSNTDIQNIRNRMEKLKLIHNFDSSIGTDGPIGVGPYMSEEDATVVRKKILSRGLRCHVVQYK